MSRVTYPQLHDREWLQLQLDRRTLTAVALEIGCSRQAVYKALRRHGLAWPELQDREYLRGRTADEIATELGCSRSAAADALWRVTDERERALEVGTLRMGR